jgi:hypothetical protein
MHHTTCTKKVNQVARPPCTAWPPLVYRSRSVGAAQAPDHPGELREGLVAGASCIHTLRMRLADLPYRLLPDGHAGGHCETP